MSQPNSEELKSFDLPALRDRLKGQKGKEFWRSLNELADSPQFNDLVRREFPRQAGLLDTLNRRDFLKVMGAALALAGLASCAPQQASKILPYAKPPEELIPGKPLYYASAMLMDGYAQPVLVKSEMGRPIKVDGNPRHPANQGASDIFMQASILDLYDPDRAQAITHQGQEGTWEDFITALAQAVGQGAGLRILTETVTSPTLNDQIQALLSQFPGSKWHQYSSASHGSARAGMNLAFGQPVDAVYHFDRAEVILSLDADFLFRETGSLRYGRDFGLRRQPDSDLGVMNRLYVVEASQTLTGANADHRLGVKPSQVEVFARALGARMGIDVGEAPAENIPGSTWIESLVVDLQRVGANALVIAGDRQPPAVHALAHAINQQLGAVGNTVTYVEPVTPVPVDQIASLQELVNDLNGGAVDLLLVLGGNPAYAAPVDLNFGDAIGQARMSAYLGLYADETADRCTWFVPAEHYLETWGDARAYDGTVSIIQPLIEPLYGGKSPYEVLAALQGQAAASGYDLVRQFWSGQLTGGNFEATWGQALSDGYLPDSAAPGATVTAQVSGEMLGPLPTVGVEVLEVVFEPDPTVWDGTFSNNAWLQELPKSLTKLTWDNAAIFSPRTAQVLGIGENQVVELSLRDRSLNATVFVQPGQPDNVVTLTLGYGRTRGGKVLTDAGYNANLIRTSAAPAFDTDLQVRSIGETRNLVTTRDHQSMENRDLIRMATLEEYRQNPNFAHAAEEEPKSLYGEWEYSGYSWGMAINLNTCIGCNACVIACQAENNIPTVGKGEVERSREMHWLRVDRYFTGSADAPEVAAFQPVPCMHCDNAPCEPVCPVEATSHSAEGINEMTYNRCVGTRYCSNNCPYKVRRFNFFKYVDDTIESLKAMRNPDVTVRSRGVMEKCTYCIQRINQSRIQAEIENRRITDGEVKTACQQACPTNAIVFGDLNDPNSAVRKLKDQPLNYGLLAELGTKPRTTYLAKVKNPNPLIPDQE